MGRAQANLEGLHAAEACARHPFKILADPIFGDLAVHPVPPDPRPRSLRRIGEARAKSVRRGARTGGARGIGCTARHEQCSNHGAGRSAL